MSASHLLYLNTHRLTAYGWRRGRLWQEDVFDPTPSGLERFAAYLRERSKCPFRLLANVGEEGHQIELIPFLRGKDRTTLVERKQGQIFFGTSLVATRSLGYEKSKRKNERLLITALTNQAHFQPWLNTMAECETPLAGLYSISQLSGILLSKLCTIPPRCLLLTMQDHSLRESFLVDGIAVFSRMAPLADGSIAGIAAGMAAEAGKMHQYLVGQRQIGRNDTLPIIVLAHASARAAVRNACGDTAGLNFEIHDIAEAAQRIGLHLAPQDNRCDPLFLHLTASAPPREQFLNYGQRHDHRIHQAKRYMLGGGLSVVGAATLFAAWNLLSTYHHRQESLTLARDESVLTRRYQEVLATFPQLGISNDTLRQLIQRHQEIEQYRRQPAQAYRYISSALDASPGIELDAIDWQLGGPSSRDGTPANKSNFQEATEEIAIVRGTVRLPPQTPPRQIVASFDDFIRHLNQLPEANSTVLQRPFDTEPGRPLKGGTDEQSPAQAPAFVVRIVWRLPK